MKFTTALKQDLFKIGVNKEGLGVAQCLSIRGTTKTVGIQKLDYSSNLNVGKYY